jgi:hypothetical protein
LRPSPLLSPAVLVAALALAAPAGAQSPAPPAGPPQPTDVASNTLATAPVDTAPPSVRRVAYRRSVLHLQISEPGRLEVRYARIDKRAHVFETKTVAVLAGDNALVLRRWMRPGRYHVAVMALDEAGNASRPLRLKLNVRR